MKIRLACIVLTLLPLAAAEKKLKLADAPAAVQATVRKETRNAQLVGLSSEVEHGQTMYELETKVNGRGRDLMIAADGSVTSVEEEVALDAIPAPAKAALQAKAAGGKIVKVEAVTEKGVLKYEAALNRNGKKSEYTVNPDGSPAK